MKKRFVKQISLLLTAVFLVSGLSGCNLLDTEVNLDTENTGGTLDENNFLTSNGNLPIEDNDGWYANWESTDVVTMYLTVREGNSDDGTNHTWDEINKYSAYYYDDLGVERYKVEGLLQVGNEDGPVEGELGYGQYAPNAIVQIRGQSSSLNDQKNYRISLRDGKGDWEGMTTINLNKHVSDTYRFTNMLCYDLMQEIDEMISARTRFVHLYVKDDTSSGNGSGFKDYGLYTFVEQMNKSYLRNHGMDRNGQMYKVNFFEFHTYEDVIMLKSDADYDVTKFEEYLEIKGSDDHSKLIQMLKELNDYSIPIEETFAKWFDEENYFTYLAFHILMGNLDTQSRNQFLYSPSNINKFYFISWDNDGALYAAYSKEIAGEEDLGFQEGISNYWGNILHRRVLQSAEYRQKLDDKINELLETVLTEENITAKADAYAKVVRPYLYSLPDIEHARTNAAKYDYMVENVYNFIQQNYETYTENLNEPMPFFLGTPYVEDGQILYNWDTSFDLDQETVTYTFEVSKNYSFTDVVYSEKDILVPGASTDVLEAGQYFYRVIATNASGYSQVPFDYYYSDDGKVFGVRCFWVTKDGEIVLDSYEEGE